MSTGMRMYQEAVLALAEISDALEIPAADALCANGNDLILERIATLKAVRPAVKYKPLSLNEIKALECMLYGCPVDDIGHTAHSVPLIRKYEYLRARGRRPTDNQYAPKQTTRRGKS